MQTELWEITESLRGDQVKALFHYTSVCAEREREKEKKAIYNIIVGVTEEVEEELESM